MSAPQNAIAMITAAQGKDKAASWFIWEDLTDKERFRVAELLASMIFNALRNMQHAVGKPVDEMLNQLGRAAAGEEPCN